MLHKLEQRLKGAEDIVQITTRVLRFIQEEKNEN